MDAHTWARWSKHAHRNEGELQKIATSVARHGTPYRVVPAHQDGEGVVHVSETVAATLKQIVGP